MQRRGQSLESGAQMKRILRWFGLAGSSDRQQVQRAQRVRLKPLHQVVFVEKRGDAVGVVNISTSGMALAATDLTKAVGKTTVAAGNELSGRIRFGSDDAETRFSIVHVGDEIIGCRFVEPAAALTGRIQSYLEYELKAISVRRIRSDVLAQQPGVEQLWFTDGVANELFVSRAGDEIRHFHISFLGHYVEGGTDSRLRFGIVLAPNASGALYKGSDLIRYVDTIDDQLSVLMHRFLEAIPELDSTLREQIEQIFPER